MGGGRHSPPGARALVEVAGTLRRRVLIVAVHDVGAATIADARWLLDRLTDAGVQPRVLKVVPAQAGDELRELVAAEAGRGSEVVLHGWTHRRQGRARGGLLDRARSRLFAGGTDEFAALDPGEMAARLELGGAWLEALGLDRGGFCPPAWLAAPGLRTALRRAGFGYLVTLRGVEDLRTGRRVTLPPAGYMGAGPVQEALVGIGSALMARPLAAVLRSPARRVFLHPQGARGSRHCARTLAELERLARRLTPATYRSILDA